MTAPRDPTLEALAKDLAFAALLEYGRRELSWPAGWSAGQRREYRRRARYLRKMGWRK